MGEGDASTTRSAAFPAKAGIQMINSDLCVRVWVPAFAGNRDVGRKNKAPFGAARHFPQRGKITDGKSSPSGGSTRVAGVGSKSR